MGLSRGFTVPYPRKARKITSHQKNSKAFVCAHFSLHNFLSLCLSQSLSFLVFVFYSIGALSYRFVRSAQQSGVRAHCSADSCARCPWPALQTPFGERRKKVWGTANHSMARLFGGDWRKFEGTFYYIRNLAPFLLHRGPCGTV